MGMFDSLFGGGGGGGNWTAAKGATVDQANTLFGQTQSGLAQQQAFLNALSAQGGIQNQANVFQQQQQLANQLGLQAQGQGPNPALAQLAQTTGANVANQAALMAGQRGAGANTGLIARQAAQQGAGIQQQAAGQAAVMRAQQQLAAQEALQRQQAMLGGLATTQVGQQANALTGYNQMALSGQQNVLGALGAQNTANAGIQAINAQGQQGILGGLLGGAGSLLGLAGGGEVPQPQQPKPTPASVPGSQGSDYQNMGIIDRAKAAFAGTDPYTGKPKPHFDQGGQVGPNSFVGKFMQGYGTPQSPSTAGLQTGTMQFGQGLGKAIGSLGKGIYNTINPMIGKQQGQLGQSDIQNTSIPQTAAHGGKIKELAAKGGHVPGKAKVKGDSLKNDKVPAVLSPKEIVLPRSVTMHPDAPQKAAEFVAAILAKQNMRKSS